MRVQICLYLRIMPLLLHCPLLRMLRSLVSWNTKSPTRHTIVEVRLTRAASRRCETEHGLSRRASVAWRWRTLFKMHWCALTAAATALAGTGVHDWRRRGNTWRTTAALDESSRLYRVLRLSFAAVHILKSEYHQLDRSPTQTLFTIHDDDDDNTVP